MSTGVVENLVNSQKTVHLFIKVVSYHGRQGSSSRFPFASIHLHHFHNHLPIIPTVACRERERFTYDIVNRDLRDDYEYRHFILDGIGWLWEKYALIDTASFALYLIPNG